jgi:proteic killer suppression protein
MEFANAATEAIYNGESTKASRRLLPDHLVGVARRKLIAIAVATKLDDLAALPQNRLKKLSEGGRAGQYSIRINDQYRICFFWDPKVGATAVEIVDYH